MKIKKGFVLREMCGEHIVTGEGLEHINFNKLISLNSTAAFLWEKIADQEFDAESMAQLLMAEYGIDHELAFNDSARLAKAWINAGIAEE